MLHKTRAIVLKTVKYRESSIILTAFTDMFGAKTYILNSVRVRKPKFSMSLFQPLSLLDLVVYNKENANLNRVSEIKPALLFSTIPYNTTKMAQVLFVAEVLNKLIRDENTSPELFEFIFSSITLFDHLTENFQNFHLQFLLKLSKYMGFSAGDYHPLIRDHFDETKGESLSELLYQPYELAPKLKTQLRSDLLDDILRFYRGQTDTPLELKSLQVYKSMI